VAKKRKSGVAGIQVVEGFSIDAEFRAQIDPLSDEEQKLLEAAILRDGCRDPVVVWREERLLLDGHHRVAICEKHGLDYAQVEISLPDREAAEDWIDENQLGRRNLTPDQFRYHLGRRYNRVKKAVGGRADRDFSGDQNEHPKTADRLATEHGVSPATVKRAAKFADEVDATPAMREAVKNREPVRPVVREMRRQEREEATRNAPPLPKGKYGLILADPPWQYDFSETKQREVENHYNTLSLAEICQIRPPAADACVLFLWATAPKLPEALRVMDAWGFSYKTNAVWDKQRVGMGYWFRGRHELLLVGTRGIVSPPPEPARAASVFSHPRGKHSEKPQAIYELLEVMFPNAKRCELFARGKRAGWTAWGNEA